jgi:hypothetical protein
MLTIILVIAYGNPKKPLASVSVTRAASEKSFRLFLC